MSSFLLYPDYRDLPEGFIMQTLEGNGRGQFIIIILRGKEGVFTALRNDGKVFYNQRLYIEAWKPISAAKI